MHESPEGKFILAKLQNELPAHFYYHNITHTLDVYQAAKAIAKHENINAADTRLLLVTALYHDCGYLEQVEDHEAASCRIARKALAGFNYTKEDINTICNIIMATKVPQQPKTLTEKIICDADLDYLGRNDFIPTGNKLYQEMLQLGKVTNPAQWNAMQIKFLEHHHYFTATSIKNRAPKKQENLRDLQHTTSNLK